MKPKISPQRRKHAPSAKVTFTLLARAIAHVAAWPQRAVKSRAIVLPGEALGSLHWES